MNQQTSVPKLEAQADTGVASMRLGEIMEDRQKHTHSLGTPENKGDASSGKGQIQEELGRLRGQGLSRGEGCSTVASARR